MLKKEEVSIIIIASLIIIIAILFGDSEKNGSIDGGPMAKATACAKAID